MSRVELKRLVDEATQEEQQFLFVCLAEKLHPNSPEQLREIDRRLDDMAAGMNRLSLEDFEQRIDRGNSR